jgi:hypothetical protein
MPGGEGAPEFRMVTDGEGSSDSPDFLFGGCRPQTSTRDGVRAFTEGSGMVDHGAAGARLSRDYFEMLGNELAPDTLRVSWLVDDSPGRGAAVF